MSDDNKVHLSITKKAEHGYDIIVSEDAIKLVKGIKNVIKGVFSK